MPRPSTLYPLVVAATALYVSTAEAQASLDLLVPWIFMIAAPFVGLGLLVWAAWWLFRGRNSAGNRSFRNKRENEAQSGRLGE